MVQPSIYKLQQWTPLATFLLGNAIAYIIFKTTPQGAAGEGGVAGGVAGGLAGGGGGFVPSGKSGGALESPGDTCLVQGLKTFNPDGTALICTRGRKGVLTQQPATHPGLIGELGVVTGRAEALGLGYRELARMSEDTKRKYAELQGYGVYIYDQLTTTYVDWQHDASVRIYGIKNTLKYHKWVWWSDADLMVQEPSVRLEELADDSFHVVVSRNWDGCDVSPQSILVRNSEVGWEFMSMWEQFADDNPGEDDQWALQRVLQHWERREAIKIIAQYLINPQPDMDLEPGRLCTPTLIPQLTQVLEPDRFEQGDFAVNLEGCLAIRADPLQKYELGCAGLAVWYHVHFDERLDAAWKRRREAAAAGRPLAEVERKESISWHDHLEQDPWNRDLGGCTKEGSKHRKFTEKDKSLKYFRRWFKYDHAGMFAKVAPADGLGKTVWKEFSGDGRDVATFEEMSSQKDAEGKEMYVLKDNVRSMFVRLSAKKADWSMANRDWKTLSKGGYEGQ